MLVEKKRAMRFFFVLEMTVLATLYITGSDGIRTLDRIQKENMLLARSVVLLEEEIQELEQEQKKWKETSFYKEKLAREQLQMARPDDEVYFLV